MLDRPQSAPPHEPPTDTPSDLRGAPANRRPAIGESFSIFLDHLRWISALLVVIGHIRQIFFADYADVTDRSLFWSAFYALTRIQHQAVLAFFLLSGAMIAGRFVRWDSWQRFNAGSYAVARLTRLWLVLVPVLLLCAIELWLIPAAYAPRECRVDAATFVGHLVFLQNLAVAPLCNNIPLWSLTNEFWYYALTGAFVFAVASKRAVPRMVAAVLIVAAVTMIAMFDHWGDKAVLPYFPIWLLGAVALHPRIPAPPILPALVVFLVGLVAVRALHIPFYLKDWLFALLALQLLVAAREVDPGSWFDRAMLRSARLSRALAGRSYSLYLVHFPICVAVEAVVLAQHGAARAQPGAFGLLIMATIIVLSYAMAQLFYWLFESRTATVKAAVEKALGVRRRWG